MYFVKQLRDFLYLVDDDERFLAQMLQLFAKQLRTTHQPSIFITHQQVIYFCLRIECLYQRTLSHLSGAPQEYAIFLRINYFL